MDRGHTRKLGLNFLLLYIAVHFVLFNMTRLVVDGTSVTDKTGEILSSANSTNNTVNVTDSPDLTCNIAAGWKLLGSDWGCCGNYDGCCTYASVICYIHDALCKCCDIHSQLCGPKCKPEADCAVMVDTDNEDFETTTGHVKSEVGENGDRDSGTGKYDGKGKYSLENVKQTNAISTTGGIQNDYPSDQMVHRNDDRVFNDLEEGSEGSGEAEEKVSL